MLWLRNTLAWATPVKVDLVGAHLEAYVDLLPTMITLRLCHRHGAGSGISKLPVELLVSIEELLADTERKEAHKVWESEYKCFRNDCTLQDHYERSRLNELRRMLRLDRARSEVLSDDDVNERLDDFILEHTSYFDIHQERRCAWEDRINCFGTLHDRERRELMMKHFGLGLWVSETRVQDTNGDDYDASRASLAYLQLPSGSPSSRHFDLSEQEREDREFYFHGGGAMQIAGDLTMPEHGHAKMQRCLNVLGLEPYVHQTEKDSVLLARMVPQGDDSKPVTSWPRLTVLSEIMSSTED